MKKQLGMAMGACLALSISLSTIALGQEKKPKPISSEDQQAIIELFKNVDSSKYRLQFNEGRRVVGNKSVGMSDIEQVKKYRSSASAGFFVFIVSGRGADEVVYIVATEPGKTESVLGKEKAARLNQIMAKYSR